ncbi:RluA family pseudouridine synthase [Clostridiaceae bacterium HSG29]|nr:RluA family pseudouridine synthase [Clostridiaceae bacterium HSG29]
MDKIEILVTEEYNNVRIDKALSNLTDELTRSYIQKLIEEEHIRINGELVANKKNVVKTDDEIVVEIPPAKELNIKAEDIELDFVYEDDDIIIVNKKQGMVVHPAPGNWEGTLVNALMYHTDKLSSINGVRRPGIVHRIDKDTSGLLMIAKNDHAHNFLSEQLKEHTTTRKYYAIVHGNISQSSGTITAPIARDKKNRLKMSVQAGGRHAVTHFKVIERFSKYTLLELQLETGRTHQIRVHMTYINHQILGDKLYGRTKEKVKWDGQLLHAKTLGFIHPTTKEYIEFDSELPEYFKNILQKVKTIR